MRSAGGGRRKAGKAEAVVSPVTGAAAPAAEDVDGQRKTAREEAGDGDAAAVEELGNEGLTGGDDEEDDDDEEEDDNGVEEEKVEERPKLADGFYEIEDIRKKRMRKGQIQFLIKWRGWPETANTWEPFDNVKPCADIIEAFEEREKVAKPTRKRKRKSSGPSSAGRKRPLSGNKQRVGRPASSRSKVKPDDLDAHSTDPSEPVGEVERLFTGEGTTTPEESKPSEEAGKAILDDNGKPDAVKMAALDSAEEGAGAVSVDLRLGEENKPSKSEASPAQRFTGARKRKSGSVRRFKQDALDKAADFQGLAAEKTVDGDTVTGVAVAEDGGLVKIVKTVAFAAAISNDIQKVSVTFVARRSDGREVQVGNEFLKSHYPALLIDFYEQHLRFGS